MTQRERMQKVVAHELPDRTPAVLAVRPEVERALMEWYAEDNMAAVHDLLGTGGWGGVGLGLDWGDYWDRCDKRTDGDWMGAGRRYLWHDDRTYEDEWGTIRRVGDDGKYVQWITGPLAHADDPDEMDFPTPDRLIVPDNLAAQVQKQKDQGLWVGCGVTQAYKMAWELCGMEKVFISYLQDLPFLEKLYDKIYALNTAILTTLTAAGVDQIGVGGDIAMQDRLIVGPHTWREVDKPYHAAMIAACKAINPEVNVFIHSDGKLDDIMPDLIEIGFNIINPIQPECMDPFAMKRLYSDRIVLHGCVGIQQILPRGTVADVRKHVTDLIEGCGYNGGLVLTSNTMAWDIPLANIVALYETARDYDMTRFR